MADRGPQLRVLFLFPDSSDIRHMRNLPTIGRRVRSEKGNVWTVAEVLQSGIHTYTVTCVAPPKGVRHLAADLLDLARNAIPPSRPVVPDSPPESPRPIVTLPPYVPIASDEFINRPIADDLPTQQLSALARVGEVLGEEGIAYWLFGGWAVDFYVGSVTRAHDDVDIAVWLKDVPRIMELLEEDGWRHAPLDDEDGGTGYERESVRLELTYLVRHPNGGIFTPLCQGRGEWSTEALADDVRELRGVRSRLVAMAPLMRRKSFPRYDPEEAAKDNADFERLSWLATGTPIERHGAARRSVGRELAPTSVADDATRALSG